MSFTKAVTFATLAFAIAGGAIAPAVAAKLHKSQTHPHVTTGLWSSTASPGRAVESGTAGRGAAAGAAGGSVGGTATGGAAAEGGGGGTGGGMGGGNGM